MKKALFFVAMATISFSSFAQVKKPAAQPVKSATSTKVDTLFIPYVKKVDTVKVRIIAYGEGNQVLWLNGYMIRTVAITGNRQEQEIADPVFTDDKLGLIKKEDIVNHTPFSWK